MGSRKSGVLFLLTHPRFLTYTPQALQVLQALQMKVLNLPHLMFLITSKC
jgi:hypothetical protein